MTVVEQPTGTVPSVGDDTSSRLVAAAAEVFAEKGYDGAGVAEIARRAGLTTGAIYGRFSGKAELLAEAIQASTSGELDRLFAEHRFEGHVTDLLATVGSHLVTREPDPGQAILLEAFVAARRDPQVQTMLREHLEARAARLRALVESSKESGLVDRQLDTAALVTFAHAVGLGFLLFEAVGLDRPAAAPWDDLVAHMLAALAPNDTAPTDTATDPTAPTDPTDPTTD